MTTRITHSMMQRNVLADLNAVSNRLVADAAEDRLQPGDRAALRRPVRHARGRWRLRQTLAATAAAPAQRRGRRGLAGGDGAVAGPDHRRRPPRPRAARPGRLSDSADATDRASIATELEQIIQSVKQNANATYRGSYLFAGSKTDTPPYEQGAADTYVGDKAGWTGSTPACCARSAPA